ncbi:MAG: FHA domain-containing protein [Deltaproteobacteria bacterium]|nr:FHA domain-containing protein [Deltaproteobacteria bacterium]
MRSRPPVGRRLWRRRRRRADDVGNASTGGAGGGADRARGRDDERDEDRAEDRDALDEGRSRDDGYGVTRQGALRFLARLFGRKAPPPPAVPVVVDPLVALLALPRGVARLDAFARALSSLAKGSAEHRRVALALQRDLTSMASEAGVDLSVFEARVIACADALIAAGQAEQAGELLARLGRRGQAAALFVEAGAIEALEEQHAEAAFAEGGPRLEARLAFQRFEALFVVGLRDDALAALERACALDDNPLYAEVLAGFRARLAGARATFSSGDDVLRVVAGLPAVVGRGEDCAVRVDSPLVSRAHVELVRRGATLVARDLVSAGGSSVDDRPLSTPQPLGLQGTLVLAGVALDYERDATRLLLRPRLRPRHVTLVLFGDAIDDTVLGAPLSLAGGRLRLVAGPKAHLNGEPVVRDALLLAGDRVTIGARTFMVARA